MDYYKQETERIIFRQLTENDIENWSEFFVNNDRLHFLGITDLSKDNYTLAQEWITKQLERNKNGEMGHLAAIEKSTGELIGLSGIIPRIVLDQPEFEIAYSLKPRYWGKGFGSEMAIQMKKYGFENKIAERFISIIEINNVDSINVAKKNGMSVLFETRYLEMDVFVFGTK